MIGRFNKEQASQLDQSINAVLTEMEEYGPESDEYPAFVAYLERLTELKAKERRQRVSPDTMLIVAGNVVGILIIVLYEQKNVLTSKGMNLILKNNP